MTRRRFLGLGVTLALVGVGATLWLRGDKPARPITRVFSAMGVRKVILRAALAPKVKVSTVSGREIKITGLPIGGAQGYHSPDPFWRETPAKDWGLDFVAKQYGSVLVISTKNEIQYIHHHYVLNNLSIGIPRGIVVVKEERSLNGENSPNLKPPT